MHTVGHSYLFRQWLLVVLGYRHDLLVDRYDRVDRAAPAALTLHVGQENLPDPADPDFLQGLVPRDLRRDLERNVILKVQVKVCKGECVYHGY